MTTDGRSYLVPTQAAAAGMRLHQLGVIAETNGLVLADGSPMLSYEDWEDVGRCIFLFGQAYQFWVGDWINWGEALFGEDSAQAISGVSERYDIAERITSEAPQTLMNWSSVCRKVAKSRRRVPPLNFTHHAEVAALTPGEQDEWLQAAIDENLSASGLRKELRAVRGKSNPDNGTERSRPNWDGKSAGERIEAAARRVYHQGSVIRNKEARVPIEPWHELGSALGEE